MRRRPLLAPNVWGRTLVRYVSGLAGFVALAIVAVTCSDLTGPKTGVNGAVQISFKWPPPGTVPVDSTLQALVGEVLSPPFSITLNGTELTRARYLFSLDSLGDTTVIKVNTTGDNVEIMGRGKRRLWATVVGATVGVDTAHRTYIYINATPASNSIDSTSLTFGSLTETKAVMGSSFKAGGVEKIKLDPTSLVWTSLDPNVATVSKTNDSVATVTAVGNGTTAVVGRFDNVFDDTVFVTVTQRLNKYRLATNQGPISARLNSIGQQITVTATAVDSLDQPMSASAPQFNTTDAGNVRIDANTGVITADGNTASPPPSVFVTLGGQQRSDNLPVVVKQVAMSVAIQSAKLDTIRSEGGEKANVNVLVPDTLGTQMRDPNAIQWVSTDNTVATVDNKTPALIKAIKTGTTQIIARADAEADTITIVVTNDPDKVELIPTSVAIRSLEDTVILSITVRNANNDKLNVIPVLTSDNPTVVQVMNDSLLVGKTEGTATVTATTANGKTASAPVTVTNAPQTLIITPTTLTLASIGDLDSTFAVDFRNGRGVVLPRSSANWSSQDITVARVGTDINKPIIAVGSGDTYVVAVSPVDPQKRDSILVTVTNAPNSITIAPAAPANLTAIGATRTFTATVFNSAGNPVQNPSITWSVLPAGAAFVSIDATTGVATALSNGTATIQATSGAATQTVSLTVAQAFSPGQSTITPGAPSITADGVATTLITAQLRDANGNSLTFGGSAVVLASSLGTLLADFSDNGNGNYTRTLRSGTVAGAAAVSGTVGGLAITNGASVSFTAGAAAKYIVTPDNLSPTAGNSVTVRAQRADINNNPRSDNGISVTFSSPSGGSFTTANPVNTDPTGVATVTFQTAALATTHTVFATSAGPISGQSAAIVTTASAAASYSITTSTTAPPNGGQVTITAQLRDAAGNPVTTPNINVTFSSGSGSYQRVNGTVANDTTTNGNGTATITFIAPTVTGTANTVTATSAGPITGNSSPITTVPAAPSAAQSTAVVPVGTVGAVTSISIQAKDAFGQNRNTSSGTVAVSVTGANTATATVIDNLTGTYTATYTPTVAGTDNVTITLGGAQIFGSPFSSTVSASSLTANAVLSVTQNGSEAGPVNIVYAVTLSVVNNSGAPITFTVAHGGATTATVGSDFTTFAGSGVFSIPQGQSTGSLTVAVLDDASLEGTELVQATISAPTNPGVTITGASATANLIDNETATAALSVTQHGAEDLVTPTNIIYTVTLSSTNNTGAPITFSIANSSGTATSATDFSPFGPTISVPNLASTGQLTVTVLDDLSLEGTETVQATISSPSSPAVSITGATATANIADNETTNAVLSVTQNGDETPTTNIVYTVTLSSANNTGSPMTFNIAKTGGTASTADHGTFPATISVPNLATTGTATVTVVDDADLESTESVTATISNPPASVSITGPSATATITDNETATTTLAVTQNGLEAGPVNIVYTVTLSTTNFTGAPITFTVANSGGTATSGSDFNAFANPGTFSIANGQTTGQLIVTVIDDALLEGTETVQATITASSNPAVSIPGAGATANVIDNETTTAALSVTQTGVEDAVTPTSIIYTVTLSSTNSSSSPMTFNIAKTGGTAAAGDHGAFPATISVASGVMTGTATVTVVDDGSFEGPETVTATISNPPAVVTITTPSATASISDNETTTAALSVTQQGNEAGPVNITYTVTLGTSNTTGSPITFDIDDALTGSATSSSDYTTITGSATISVANGSTTGTFTVVVLNDAVLESSETLDATISNPSLGAQINITTATAQATIAEQGATAVLSMSQAGAEAASPTNIIYTVTLNKTNVTGGPITFDIDDAGGGTAISGSDYVPIAGGATISVPNASATGTFAVVVLNDAVLEATETVNATILNPPASVTITGASATGNIIDNETATAALSVTQHGNEAGPVNIQYTVTLNRTNTTGAPITFAVSNSGGTATSGADFSAFDGPAAISVANGVTTGTLNVTVLNDGLLEATETVEAAISDPSLGGQISITTPTAMANIAEEGATNAVLSVSANGAENPNSPIQYLVTLSKTNMTGAPITFDIDDAGTGTATSGSDYTAILAAATISVANGSATGTFNVAVTDDALLESNETVIAAISGPSSPAVTVTGPSATASITDNETTIASIAKTQDGNETGPVAVEFTVSIDKINNTGAPITFNLAMSGSATNGTDYSTAPLTVSIANGSDNAIVSLAVSDDALLESNESVTATISTVNPKVSAITPDNDTATITDNDTAIASITKTQDGDETGPVAVEFTVAIDKINNTGAPITFNLAMSGTATNGTDYSTAPLTVSIANGSDNAIVSLAVSDDALLESVETVTATISTVNPKVSAITPDNDTATITDNDTAIASIAKTQDGNETGPVAVEFTVSIDKINNTGAPIVFDLAMSGTATNGTDYTTAPLTVSIANGSDNAIVSLAVSDDALLESNESVTATISTVNPKVSAITPDNDTGTITDNETTIASITATQDGNEQGPVSVQFTIAIDKINNTGAPITFNLAMSGTATNGTDYSTAPLTVDIANGTDNAVVTLTVTNDVDLEPTETVIATISTSNTKVSAITPDNDTADILDNEAPTALAATFVGSDGFDANWTTVSGATTYLLDVSTDNFSTFVAGYEGLDVGNVTSHAVTGLSSATPHQYRVRAQNALATSLNSNVITQATDATSPAAPTALAATAVGSTTFDANWTSVPLATDYRLDVSTDPSFGSFVTGYNDLNVGNVTTFTVNTNLSASTTYYYRVRTFVVLVGTSANSNRISVTTTP